MKLLVVKTVLTSSPDEAAEFIRRGGLVAFPTETVYGLGGDIFNEDAVKMIYAAKKRPRDNPLIAHIAGIVQIEQLATDVSEQGGRFIENFFPGPLTLVLKKSSRVPFIATAGLDTIGVRMPSAQLARNFLESCAVPVAAPSANLSGRPSPTTWQAVMEDLDGRIDCILQGGDTEIGIESTIVDCTGEVPILLRQGAVSLAELQRVAVEVRFYEHREGDNAKSPGMKHRHYSPSGKVVIVKSSADAIDPQTSAFIGFDRVQSASFASERICGSVKEYAHSLFEFFRQCDRRDIATIYCESVPETGIGAALMDRLRRASKAI